MTTTPNRNYPIVAGGNELALDVLKLIVLTGMVDADVQALFAALSGKANLAGAAFTVSPTAPTPNAGDDSNTLATTAWVNAATALAIANLVNGAPSALDALNELAAAMGNNPNFAADVATLLGLKANSADVYLKTAINTMLADMATKTGSENLINKTLTSPTLILEHSAGFAQTALGRMGLDETAMAVMFGDGSVAQPLRPSAEKLIAEYKITTGVSTLLLPDLTKYSMIEIVTSTTSTSSWTLYYQPSYDGGVSYDTTVSNYYGNTWGSGNGSWVTSVINTEPGFRIMCFSASANSFATSRALITNLRGGKRSICAAAGRMWQSDGAMWGLDGAIFNSTQSPVTKARIVTNSGAAITGHVAVKGWLA